MSHYRQDYYLKNKQKSLQTTRNWKLSHPERTKELNQKSELKLKLDVFNHYSNGTMKCKCCEETILEFLSLDHINGGGNRQRNQYGSKLYRKLRKASYPSGFQILCYNCNMAKGFFGKCPHN